FHVLQQHSAQRSQLRKVGNRQNPRQVLQAHILQSYERRNDGDVFHPAYSKQLQGFDRIHAFKGRQIADSAQHDAQKPEMLQFFEEFESADGDGAQHQFLELRQLRNHLDVVLLSVKNEIAEPIELQQRRQLRLPGFRGAQTKRAKLAMRHRIKKIKAFEAVDPNGQRFQIPQTCNLLDPPHFRVIIHRKRAQIRQLSQKAEVASGRGSTGNLQGDVRARCKKLFVQQIPRFSFDRLRGVQELELALAGERFDLLCAEGS